MTSIWFLFLFFLGPHLLSLVDTCTGTIVPTNDTTTLFLATTEKRVTYDDDSLHRLGEQKGENLNSAAQEDMETTVVESKIFTGGMKSVERRRLGDQKSKYFEHSSETPSLGINTSKSFPFKISKKEVSQFIELLI